MTSSTPSVPQGNWWVKLSNFLVSQQQQNPNVEMPLSLRIAAGLERERLRAPLLLNPEEEADFDFALNAAILSPLICSANTPVQVICGMTCAQSDCSSMNSNSRNDAKEEQRHAEISLQHRSNCLAESHHHHHTAAMEVLECERKVANRATTTPRINAAAIYSVESIRAGCTQLMLRGQSAEVASRAIHPEMTTTPVKIVDPVEPLNGSKESSNYAITSVISCALTELPADLTAIPADTTARSEDTKESKNDLLENVVIITESQHVVLDIDEMSMDSDDVFISPPNSVDDGFEGAPQTVVPDLTRIEVDKELQRYIEYLMQLSQTPVDLAATLELPISPADVLNSTGEYVNGARRTDSCDTPNSSSSASASMWISDISTATPSDVAKGNERNESDLVDLCEINSESNDNKTREDFANNLSQSEKERLSSSACSNYNKRCSLVEALSNSLYREASTVAVKTDYHFDSTDFKTVVPEPLDSGDTLNSPSSELYFTPCSSFSFGSSKNDYAANSEILTQFERDSQKIDEYLLPFDRNDFKSKSWSLSGSTFGLDKLLKKAKETVSSGSPKRSLVIPAHNSVISTPFDLRKSSGVLDAESLRSPSPKRDLGFRTPQRNRKFTFNNVVSSALSLPRIASYHMRKSATMSALHEQEDEVVVTLEKKPSVMQSPSRHEVYGENQFLNKIAVGHSPINSATPSRTMNYDRRCRLSNDSGYDGEAMHFVRRNSKLNRRQVSENGSQPAVALRNHQPVRRATLTTGVDLDAINDHVSRPTRRLSSLSTGQQENKKLDMPVRLMGHRMMNTLGNADDALSDFSDEESGPRQPSTSSTKQVMRRSLSQPLHINRALKLSTCPTDDFGPSPMLEVKSRDFLADRTFGEQDSIYIDDTEFVNYDQIECCSSCDEDDVDAAKNRLKPCLTTMHNSRRQLGVGPFSSISPQSRIVQKESRSSTYSSNSSATMSSVASTNSSDGGVPSSNGTGVSIGDHPTHSRLFVEALFDHVSINADELPFRQGDIIVVSESGDRMKYWYGYRIMMGTHEDMASTSHSGWFPSDYVRLLVDQESVDLSQHSPSLTTSSVDTTTSLNTNSSGGDISPPLHSSTSPTPAWNRHKMERMRTNVIREIITTERDYFKLLENLVEGFLTQARRRSDMFSSEQVQVIFGNLELIYQLHRQFLDDLELCIAWPTLHTSEIGRCFLRYERTFEIYSDYCNNHPLSIAELSRLDSVARYRHFFEACRLLRDMTELSLDGFLLSPVQRICKYPLQLGELLKCTHATHPDFSHCSRALERMRAVAHRINDRKRRLEGLQKLLLWQKSIESWQGDGMLSTACTLIYSGDVQCRRGHSASVALKDATMFLFDHIVIICRRDLLKRSQLIYKDRISTDKLEVIALSDGRDSEFGLSVKHAIKLHSFVPDNKCYLIVCKSKGQKQRWLQAFQKEAVVAQETSKCPTTDEEKRIAQSVINKPFVRKDFRVNSKASESVARERRRAHRALSNVGGGNNVQNGTQGAGLGKKLKFGLFTYSRRSRE